MFDAPSDLDISGWIGVRETEVAFYRGSMFRLKDDSWLIHFSFAMLRALRQRFTDGLPSLSQLKPGGRRMRELD